MAMLLGRAIEAIEEGSGPRPIVQDASISSLMSLDFTIGKSSVAVAAGDWNKEPRVMALSVTAIAIISASVFSRLFVRWWTSRRLMLDDILMFLSGVFACSFSVVLLAAIPFDLGAHLSAAPRDPRTLSQLLASAAMAYSCTTTAAKLSVIVTLLREFPFRLLRSVLLGTSVVVICLFLSTIPLTMFQCAPVKGTDNQEDPEIQCIHFIDYEYISTIIDAGTSMILIATPAAYIPSLDVTKVQKYALAVAFLVGSLAPIAGIDRLASLSTLVGSQDITYDIVPTLLWALVVCIVLTVLPCIAVMVGLIVTKNSTGLRFEFVEGADRHRSVFGQNDDGWDADCDDVSTLGRPYPTKPTGLVGHYSFRPESPRPPSLSVPPSWQPYRQAARSTHSRTGSGRIASMVSSRFGRLNSPSTVQAKDMPAAFPSAYHPTTALRPPWSKAQQKAQAHQSTASAVSEASEPDIWD